MNERTFYKRLLWVLQWKQGGQYRNGNGGVDWVVSVLVEVNEQVWEYFGGKAKCT